MALFARHDRWRVRGAASLLLVLATCGLLAGAWWDWTIPLAERVYPLPWQRLLWMIPAAWGIGLALWAVAAHAAGAAGAARSFWLALAAGLFPLRHSWPILAPEGQAFGLQPGSSVWVYGLALVTAAVVSLPLARIGRAQGLGAFLRRRGVLLVAGAAALYVLVFGLLSLARHQGFRSHALDLGTMDQAAWNTAQGRFLERTPLYRNPGDGARYASRLLDAKLELVFIPIAALYRLWPDPRLLLILQTALLGAGALPLYRIARRETLPGAGALLLPLAYLCSLPLHYVNLADFHPSALMVPFLFAAWYTMRAARWRWYYVWVALALCCRVDAAFALLGLGVAAVLRPGPARRHGLITLALGAAWLVVDFGLLVPAMRRLYGPGADDLVLRRFGGGPLQVLGTLLAQPSTLLHLLLDQERMQVVWDLLAPLGFVPLLGPLGLLPALPVLLINLLARSEWQHSIYAHYMAPLIPFIWIGAVEGISWLARPASRKAGSRSILAWRRAHPLAHFLSRRAHLRMRRGSDDGNPLASADARSSASSKYEEACSSASGRFAEASSSVSEKREEARSSVSVAGVLPLLILLNTLLVAWLFSPYPPGRAFALAEAYQPSSYEANLRAVLALVPDGASVCAQSDLHPHLAHRRDVSLFPYCRLGATEEAEYVALDLDPNATKSPLGLHTFYELVEAWLARPEYGVAGQRGGALLLQRGASRASIPAVRAALDAYGRGFYQVAWVEGRPPGHLSAGMLYHLPLELCNEGPQIWHSQGPLPVRVSYRWLDAAGVPIDLPALRTDLPHRVAPDHAARLRAALLTPPTPGAYILEWNLLREGDAWFRDRGGDVLRQQVLVE